MEFQKYDVKEKKEKVRKIIKKIYMKFAFKKKGLFFFFCKVIGYKSENQRNNRGLKKFFLIKKEKRKNDCKNIFRTFSGFVVSIVGSVHFWLVPWSDLYFSRSIGPFLCSR